MLWDMLGSWKGEGAGGKAGMDPGALNARGGWVSYVAKGWYVVEGR